MIVNYDPDISWAQQTVKVTVMQLGYSKTFEVVIGGNCLGFDIFEAAVNTVFENLDRNSDAAFLELKNADGDSLSLHDKEIRLVEWLKELVVSIEIVNQETLAKVFHA